MRPEELVWMPKGGARARSGPAPDPNALRRERDAGEWVTLPAEGRDGPVPEWPLPDAAARELLLWAAMWRRPQALMWERFGQQFEVALYVRRLVDAEQRDASVNLATLVRQMADSLGLTTPGLRSNRWRIEAASAATSGVGGQPATPRSSSRSRLKVVPSAGDSES